MMQCGRLSIICAVRYSSFLNEATTAGIPDTIDSSSSLPDEQCGSRNTKTVSR